MPRRRSSLAVPDLERLCREYLAQLDRAAEFHEPAALRRYRWIQVELLDQMVRRRPGGAMQQMLGSGDFDREYVEGRMGRELVDGGHAVGGEAPRARLAALRTIPPRELGPRIVGELKRRFLPPATGSTRNPVPTARANPIRST